MRKEKLAVKSLVGMLTDTWRSSSFAIPGVEPSSNSTGPSPPQDVVFDLCDAE